MRLAQRIAAALAEIEARAQARLTREARRKWATGEALSEVELLALPAELLLAWATRRLEEAREGTGPETADEEAGELFSRVCARLPTPALLKLIEGEP